MHCELGEREDLFVCEDPLVRRFRESLEVGGLHATLAGTLNAVSMNALCVLSCPDNLTIWRA